MKRLVIYFPKKALTMQFVFQLARLGAMLILIALMASVSHIIAFDEASETIAVSAEDCATQKVSFTLGDKVCASATESPLGPPVQRRFAWTAPNCSLICPSGIARSNKPGECGAVINYPTPTATGDCGAITCSPPPGAFFPIGTTTVFCSSIAGPSGAFAVTVQNTQSPAITGVTASPLTLSPVDRKMRDEQADRKARRAVAST